MVLALSASASASRCWATPRRQGVGPDGVGLGRQDLRPPAVSRLADHLFIIAGHFHRGMNVLQTDKGDVHPELALVALLLNGLAQRVRRLAASARHQVVHIRARQKPRHLPPGEPLQQIGRDLVDIGPCARLVI